MKYFQALEEARSGEDNWALQALLTAVTRPRPIFSIYTIHKLQRDPSINCNKVLKNEFSELISIFSIYPIHKLQQDPSINYNKVLKWIQWIKVDLFPFKSYSIHKLLPNP